MAVRPNRSSMRRRGRRASLPGVVVALATLATAVFSQTTFEPPQWLPVSQDKPQALCTADLDGDGDADVLVGSQLDDQVAWYENEDGLGTFGPAQPVGSAVVRPEWVRAADLDGDLDLDVVVAAELGHEIVWFANLDGEGTFGPALQVTAEVTQPHAVEAADLDGDGDLDLVSASEGDDEIAWYENLDGAGSFGPQQVIVAGADGASSLAIADVDGDGDLDVLSAWEYDDVLAWSENLDGAGSFGPPRTISDAVDTPRSVATADLDGDGDLDVLSAAWVGGAIAWYPNLDGEGTFGPAQALATGELGAHQVLAADLDEDGDQDVLYASAHGFDGAGWFENLDGQGSFGPRLVLVAATIADIHVADLDADQDLDVLSALGNADAVGWSENELRPWVDLGQALAGTRGPPQLEGDGPLAPNGPAWLRLSGAREQAATTILAGVERLDLPFHGGVLVPAPELVQVGLTTDASGSLELFFRWPQDVPPGTTVFIQAWIVDPLGPEGFAASNGLAGTTPP